MTDYYNVKGESKKKPFLLPQIITQEELKKIVDTVRQKKYKLGFMLGFYECMRVSEVARLRKEHVDTNLKLLLIKQAKGKKDRNIPIAPEVMGGLKHLPVGNDTAKDHGIRAIQIKFNRESKKAIGRKLNFHILRHSGITYYLTKKKWSSLEVQRLAGHSRIATTEVYTHINPQDLVSRMWEEK